MQPFEYMGAHNKSPPDDLGEIVTDDFRKAVNEILVANRLRNKAEHRKKGDPGYLISNHADLADEATRGDKTLLSRIIGPAKPGSKKLKPMKRSKDLGRIRAALKMKEPETTSIEVPANRAVILKVMADLPDGMFDVFEKEVARLSGK